MSRVVLVILITRILSENVQNDYIEDDNALSAFIKRT